MSLSKRRETGWSEEETVFFATYESTRLAQLERWVMLVVLVLLVAWMCIWISIIPPGSYHLYLSLLEAVAMPSMLLILTYTWIGFQRELPAHILRIPREKARWIARGAFLGILILFTLMFWKIGGISHGNP